MTFKSLKEEFENEGSWWPYAFTALSPDMKTRWSGFTSFGVKFAKLEILTGYDDYQPGHGFRPAEAWRTKQIYRLTDDNRMIEVSKTEALELLKHAKKMSEEGEKV